MIICLIIIALLSVQSETEGIVISLNGVHLREGPSTSSKKITALAYRESVLILDTIFYDGNEVSQEPTDNWWFLVKTSNQEGYVYGHFIVRKTLEKRAEWLDEELGSAGDGYIAKLGNDCNLNIPKDMDYKFIIYSKESGIKDIAIEAISIKKDIFMDMMPISISIKGVPVKQYRNAVLIGLRKEKQMHLKTEKDRQIRTCELTVASNEYKMGRGKIAYKYTKEHGQSIYFVQKNSTERVGVSAHASQVLFHGDLDHDGNEDLIIFHGEIAGILVHYEVEETPGGNEVIRIRSYAQRESCC